MKSRLAKIRMDLKVSIDGQPIEFSVDVPKGPTTPGRMLPVFRSACGTIVRAGIARVEGTGREISCGPACGACCRQMVPISETEAAMIRELVEEMPDERRRAVRERFANAVTKLDAAGLLERFRSEPQPVGPEYRELGLEYFHLGIPCPFLEDESCSIHPDRPLVCREYLVVSPPENCQRINGEPVEVVRMPLEASKALTALGTKWTPLTMVLDQPEIDTKPVPGTKIATQFFSNLTHTNLGKG